MDASCTEMYGTEQAKLRGMLELREIDEENEAHFG
jgi:hypothetical protein